ncbi:hypothetical protein C8J56DRAFT_788700, partial [Mycena floridula]
TKLEGTTESLAGRVHNIRASGNKLVLYDLHGEGKKRHSSIATHEIFRQGAIVGVTGTPSRTKKEELSISPSTMTLLAPNLHQLPSSHFGLKDQETRYRKRYLDLIVSPETRTLFITRSKIINYTRRFLDDLGFIEVETPITSLHRTVYVGEFPLVDFVAHKRLLRFTIPLSSTNLNKLNFLYSLLGGTVNIGSSSDNSPCGISLQACFFLDI